VQGGRPRVEAQLRDAAVRPLLRVSVRSGLGSGFGLGLGLGIALTPILTYNPDPIPNLQVAAGVEHGVAGVAAAEAGGHRREGLARGRGGVRGRVVRVRVRVRARVRVRGRVRVRVRVRVRA